MYEYLNDLAVGYAMPITRVRQLAPFTAADLTRMLDGFHPPQGYTFVEKNPQLAAVCDRFAAGTLLREMTITHP